MLAPVGIFAILLSPYVGRKIGTTDPRRLSTVAFARLAIVLWMRSLFNTDADFTTMRSAKSAPADASAAH